MKKFLILLILSSGLNLAQVKDPDKILDEVKDKFSKVEDYEVDVKVKVDVDFIKVPDTEAKLYYKQPDKTHIESERFAMLPREGLDFSPVSLLKDKYTAIYERDEKLEGINTAVVKVIPLGDQGNILLSTLWVDRENDVIRKVETSTKTAGTFSIELNYDNKKLDYPLPSSMEFNFNVDEMNLPKGMAGELKKDKNSKSKPGKTTGKVYINYSNYKVNKGIPDNIFQEKQQTAE